MGGSLSLTAINTFFEGTFSRAMAEDGTMIDQIFSLGVLAFSISIILLIKDWFDGKLPKKRREMFVKSFLLAGILVGASLVMANISTDTVTPEMPENAISNILYGGTSSTPLTQLGNNFVMNPSAIATGFFLVELNKTTWDLDKISKLRGLSFNFTDDGITTVDVKYGATFLFRSTNDPDNIQIEETNGKSYVNLNFTDVDSLIIQNAQTSGATPALSIAIAYNNNWSASTSQAFEVTLTETNESELANMLVWIVMSLALYVPILTYLDFEDRLDDFSKQVQKSLGLRR